MEDYTLAEIRSKFFWQETPVKLLSYARDLSKLEGDFNRYISYLLLDIGMETLLKTYLCLDSDISKAKKLLNYSWGFYREFVRYSFYNF